MNSETHSIFTRTEKLVGRETMRRLAQCHVALFGLGGVGSYAAEALVRGGVGRLTIADHDIVSQSNINRQLYALTAPLANIRQKLRLAGLWT